MVNLANEPIEQLITPKKVLRLLRDGNVRHRMNRSESKNSAGNCFMAGNGRRTLATILNCADILAPPETIFDQPAEIFHKIYVPGNTFNEEVLSNLEFSCRAKCSKLLMVIGHTRCAAIKDSYSRIESGDLLPLLERIRPSISRHQNIVNKFDLPNEKLIDFLTEIHVRSALGLILGRSLFLRRMIEKGEVLLSGAMYDEGNGRVRFF